ncbi:hypothetical protein [Nonomuraea sp. NPDC002799]
MFPVVGGKAIVSREDVVEGLTRIFPRSAIDGEYILLSEQLRLSEDQAHDRIPISEVDSLIESLSGSMLVRDAGVAWADHAEFLITPLGDGRFDRIFSGNSVVGYGENALSYAAGPPSRELVILLCAFFANATEHRRSRRLMFLRDRFRRASRYGPVRDGEKVTYTSVLDAAADFMPMTTLKVAAPGSRNDFEGLATSFLFHAAYNLDSAARLSGGFDEVFRDSRIQRVRRVDPSGLDAPKRVYGSDLVQHYLMGVSAEIPLLEYLAYYHIAEHYFEKVFNDDLVEQVRNEITDPSFSARRSTDIHRVIKAINKVQRQVREEGGVNEQRALQLVLERFVDIDRLTSDLNAYDSSLITYYKTSHAPFAESGKADLTASDHSEVKGALAKRIYKVRNALVHAKEGALPKYAPFVHDIELAREIPLMRFAAEQIIIAHGKVL